MSIKPNSDVDPDSLKYELSLVKWTEAKIELLMDYDIPTALSRGKKPDDLNIKIIRPEMFRTANN